MTQTSQFPCNTTVKVTEVSEVEGNKGPQWKLSCEFPWTGKFPEWVWIDIDFSFPWRPEAGSTYPAVVNRRDLKEGKDADTEWNWRHWINGFTHDENLAHYKKQGYSPPSNQSPPAEAQRDGSPTPVPLSSGTIGDVLPGGEFGNLLKAAIFEEKDFRAANEPINYERIQELFLNLVDVSVILKSLQMPNAVVPLQDDPPPRFEGTQGQPIPPWGDDDGPDPTDEREA